MSSYVTRYTTDSGSEGELPTLHLDVVLTHEEGKTPFEISEEIINMINKRSKNHVTITSGTIHASKLSSLNI